MKKRQTRRENLRMLAIALILPGLILAALFVTHVSRAGNEEKKSKQQLLSPLSDPNMPKHIDARAGALSRVGEIVLENTQKKAIYSLQNKVGGEENLRVI